MLEARLLLKADRHFSSVESYSTNQIVLNENVLKDTLRKRACGVKKIGTLRKRSKL